MHWTSVEVIKSSKPSSLLHRGINYGRKMFIVQIHGFQATMKNLLKNADFVKIQFS